MGINNKAWGIGFKRAIGDESNPTYAIALDDTSKSVHICGITDVNTDWNVSAGTYPDVYIHSITTPATDYLKLYHTGSYGCIDSVGGDLELLVAGVGEVILTSAALSPFTSNGNALGTTSLMWADLFLASGGVINFSAGDVTITHSAAALTTVNAKLVIGAPTAPASVATTPGTAAGAVLTITGAVGGATSIATTGVGGIGGGYAITGGAGGLAAAAATAATGGAGGAFAVTGGAGGASAKSGAGTNTGGAGGAIAFTTGAGGAVGTGTGTNTGGASGAITLTTGVGGAAADGTDTGGASGTITIATGTGGAGDTGGASGALTLKTGAAGAGGSPAVGGIDFQPGGSSKWIIDSVGNLSSAGALTNVSADGAVVATGGIAFTDVANAHIDDATHGDGTTTIYIGNQTITTASDVRLKTDIKDWIGQALDLLRQGHLVEFSYNLPGGGSQTEGYGPNARGRYLGFVAQENIKWAPWAINAGAGKDCPECVEGKACSKHSPWSVEYQHLVPLVVKGIQELDARLVAVEKK